MMTLNHGLSGYVCGRVLLPAVRRHAPVGDRPLGWAFFLGAMAPDLDILSRALLGSQHFFSAAWYGHRQASHSVLGALVLGLLGAALLYRPLLGRARAQASGASGGPAPSPWVAYAWLAGAFWVGGLIHIVGDLGTPARPMPVLWPLDVYWGALRHIGWFSPYLLWLFLTVVALDWSARGLSRRVAPVRPWLGHATWLLYGLAAYRWVDFLVTSRYDSSWQWLEYQRSLLPEAMITPFTQGVRFLWFWLTR